MKILQIITSLGVGGAEKLVTELTVRLNLKGITTDLLVLVDIPSPLRHYLTTQGIKVIFLSKGNLRKIYNPLLIFRIRRFLSQYDIVHTHLFAAQYWTVFAKMITNSNCKLITTEHSPNNHRGNIALIRYVDRLVYSYYDKIVCISDQTENNICNRLKKTSGVIKIENGIDLDIYRNSLPYKKSHFSGVLSEDYLLINVAGFRYEKDQDTLIRSMSLLPSDMHLLLVGDGVRRKELEELCHKENVSNRVHFLGIRNDVPRLLKTADIVIMSSHWEGLSLSSVEGMASGRPFVASDVEGLKDLVLGNGVLFAHQKVEDLVSKILKLQSDKIYNQKVIAGCQKKAEQYSIQRTLESYIALYKNSLL